MLFFSRSALIPFHSFATFLIGVWPQISYVAREVGCRWAAIFGGDRYLLIYISYHREDGRPVFCYSDVLPFTRCTEGGRPESGASRDTTKGVSTPDFDTQLPLWGSLVYMLLSSPETDKGLFEELELEFTDDSAPGQQLGSYTSADGNRRSPRFPQQIVR